MIDYVMMTEGQVLTSCLHGGPLPLAKVARAAEEPYWLERESDLPPGTVAALLNALCRAYGSCGVMAVDGETVVAKVRFGPAGLDSRLPECVQQDAELVRAFDPRTLPARSTLQTAALRLWCVQVADEWRGRGLATALVERTVAWARAAGWGELRAQAILPLPPLLAWTGLLSRDTYVRLGFAVTGEQCAPELVEGVQHMRAGGHGEPLQRQWDQLTSLSDGQAGTVYDMALSLTEALDDRGDVRS